MKYIECMMISIGICLIFANSLNLIKNTCEYLIYVKQEKENPKLDNSDFVCMALGIFLVAFALK